MKARTAARLAWLMGVLTFAMFFGTMALVASRPPQLPRGIEPVELFDLLEYVPFLAFAGLGVLIVARRPQNPIGWMFTAIGFLVLGADFATEYALYALYTNPGSLFGGALLAWVSPWLWLFGVALIILSILLFPNGRLLSRRWRPLAWLIAVDTAVMAIGAAVYLWPARGLQLLTDIEDATVSPVAKRIVVIGFLVLFVTLLPAAASLLLRFRRARGDERQQLKWVAYGTGVLVASAVFSEGVEGVMGISPSAAASVLVNAIGILALPVATGVAILRYRLYDIDFIINRTLVYGALTAVLALVYLGGVVGVGGLVRGITGQEKNTLVVAASTLAVAGLFRPARARIQAFIDRRFYRSKYDAQQTIADFSARMREQIDLDSLTNEMTAVVRDTVQPTHVSLWIRS